MSPHSVHIRQQPTLVSGGHCRVADFKNVSDSLFVTLIRNPRERFISWYFYLKENYKTGNFLVRRGLPYQAEKLNISDFATYCLKENYTGLYSEFTRFSKLQKNSKIIVGKLEKQNEFLKYLSGAGININHIPQINRSPSPDLIEWNELSFEAQKNIDLLISDDTFFYESFDNVSITKVN